jgi:vitamin B12 transporter
VRYFTPFLSTLTTFGCTTAAFAADTPRTPTDPLEQIIVTATRAADGVSSETLGASVTVIDAKAMQERQVRIVSDALRDVPGVAVNRAGTVGGQTQVRVRGTEGNHVLVLIDGMEAADPFFGEFDFATLMADEVARVEVLRGQQSALYGSDAIGGVVHYLTAGGREQPGLSARVEAGSFNSWEGTLRAAGATDTLDYAVSAGYQTTDGVPTSRFGTRKVGAENGVVSGRVTYEPTEDVRVKAVTRYAYTDADTNEQDFSSPFGIPPYGYVVDSDAHYRNHALYGLVRGELESFDDAWVNALTIQGVDADRAGFSGGIRSSGDDGSRLKGSYESTFRFGSDAVHHALTGALDFEREEVQNTGPFLNTGQALKRRIDNTGSVAQYDLAIGERIGIGAALRHDDNERFADADTYRIQGSYRFPTDTRVRAAAGSGIKNPSVTELFGFDPESFIGNPDLKPERSEGWEVGVEQSFAERAITVGITYFDSTLRDEIFTNFVGPNFIASPVNLTTDSTQHGVEVFLAARLGTAWSIDASYTDLDSKQNGVEEVRRPPHIGSLNVGWRGVGERLGLNVTVRYNGEQLDSNFTGVGPSRIALGEYTLANLDADFALTDKTQIYGRIENAFDEDYTEIYTYRTDGRGACVGAQLRV